MIHKKSSRKKSIKKINKKQFRKTNKKINKKQLKKTIIPFLTQKSHKVSVNKSKGNVTLRIFNAKRYKKGGGTKITIETNSFNRLFLVAQLLSSTPKSFVFEYSSGKSNIGQNFPNTFLPIKHVEVDCYIKKSGDLYKTTLYNNVLFNDKLTEFISGSGCPIEAGMKHLEYFINRFGLWEELQISAALGGGRDTKSVWDIREFPYFQKLREFALNNDYDYETKTFIARSETIDLFNWKEKGYIPFGEDYDKNCDFRIINEWLKQNNCIITYNTELSGPIVLNDKNVTFYKIKLRNASYKLTDILDPVFNIQLPKTLDPVPEENEFKKQLNDMINKITTNIPNVRKKIEKDLNEVEQSSPELLKYKPFLKFKIVKGVSLQINTDYEIDGEMGNYTTIQSALQKAQELYPYYTDSNPFNWEYC